MEPSDAIHTWTALVMPGAQPWAGLSPGNQTELQRCLELYKQPALSAAQELCDRSDLLVPQAPGYKVKSTQPFGQLSPCFSARCCRRGTREDEAHGAGDVHRSYISCSLRKPDRSISALSQQPAQQPRGCASEPLPMRMVACAPPDAMQEGGCQGLWHSCCRGGHQSPPCPPQPCSKPTSTPTAPQQRPLPASHGGCHGQGLLLALTVQNIFFKVTFLRSPTSSKVC